MKADVAIIGGGMVGMTLAVALAQGGVSVAVFERESPDAQLAPEFDGRVSAVALGSKRLLERIGAWCGMEAFAEPIFDIRVSDGNSPFFLHYDHRELSGRAGGSEPFGWIVENRHIRMGLAAAAKSLPSLRVVAPAEIDSFDADSHGVSVGYRSAGQTHSLAARLLIGADGKKSRLRLLADIPSTEIPYTEHAIVCTIAHEKPHGGLAQERFLPAGPFAVLPMTKNRSSLVWTEAAENIRFFMELPEAEFVQEIRERVGGYLGEIREAGPRFCYPLSVLHAHRYTGPRLALIGDAAHAIHPIAGQGVNLGFRDAAVLAELIVRQAGRGLDVGAADVLAQYAQWRRFDNLTMLAVTDGLNRLFKNTFPPLALARGLGMWGVSRLPPVKRFFMRHAMGLAGDVPPLMRAG